VAELLLLITETKDCPCPQPSELLLLPPQQLCCCYCCSRCGPPHCLDLYYWEKAWAWGCFLLLVRNSLAGGWQLL
jgi:hypothetical protein